MSDDDDFMQESDQEEYDFEYEDDDDDEDGDIGIENKYYNAKQIKGDNPEEAVDEFLGIPELVPEKNEWGFKGLKQAIKLELILGRYESAVEHYRELLTYVKKAVTRNYAEKSINGMLEYLEKCSGDEKAYQCMETFYSSTLHSFQNTNNERLWLKTNIKLARLWLKRREFGQLSKKVRELHRACQRDDGTDDSAKGTYSLEIYAIEIQMCVETKNNKRLSALYQRALRVRSAVPHPQIMGIIRECGGKMHMSEENWEEAQSDFFESFRNYDEAGSMQRVQVLKYLVLTTLLMKSDINPFDSQETKPYKNDPRIAGMKDLVDAFQRDDIHAYEAVLRDNKELLADPFIAENIDEISRNMRTKAILKLIAPYKRFSLKFISKHLEISVLEVQDIISYLIIDKVLEGKIDDENSTVVITDEHDQERLKALDAWTTELDKLWHAVLSKPTQEDEGLSHSMTPEAAAAMGPGQLAYGQQGGRKGKGHWNGKSARQFPRGHGP